MKYSHQTYNLPVQIGDFHYRYTADGQRYYKEVFDTHVYYLMDAEITAGVFAVNKNIQSLLDTQGAITSETEPNDSWQQANGPVGVDPVSGVQDGDLDHDWYFFDVEQPGIVNLHLDKEGIAMDVSVFDSGLNKLASDDSGYGPRLIPGIEVTPGRYYIQVAPREQHSQQIPYTLELQNSYELDYWNILGHGVEGKVLPDNTRRYYYKDHLGSTRMVVNEAGDVQSATDYYPFGMFMEGRSMASDAAKEGFTGHERDDEVGLDYMVARRYDPALGRFLGVDPILHQLNPNELAGVHNGNHYRYSPYAYTFNNPVIYTDPDGRNPFIGVAIRAAVGYVAKRQAKKQAIKAGVASAAKGTAASGMAFQSMLIDEIDSQIFAETMDVPMDGGSFEVEFLDDADAPGIGEGLVETVPDKTNQQNWPDHDPFGNFGEASNIIIKAVRYLTATAVASWSYHKASEKSEPTEEEVIDEKTGQGFIKQN